ncbi:B12-binding domain-containing radical SAM protein [Desulfobacter sp.]
MKILLVQSLLNREFGSAVYPIGLAYIGTAIRHHNHEVRIFDPNIATEPMKELIQELDYFQPDVAGVSLRNIDNQYRIQPYYFYKNFQTTIKTVRNWNSDIALVVGGPGFSMFSQTIMENNLEIDFGVYLEGEESFPELLDNMGHPEKVKGVYFRNGGQSFFTGERPALDFSLLPFPYRDFHDISPYKSQPFAIGLQTKRGCPLKCIYCNYPHLNGKQLRLRSIQHIVREIEYLRSEYGVHEITFTDSVLNLPHQHSIELFQEIIEQKLDIQWNAYMHIKQITHDYVKLAISSGCKTMLFSPDGYSQSALNGMKKGITTTEIKENIELFHKLPQSDNIKVAYCFFLSPFGETLVGLLTTLMLALKWKIKRQKRIDIMFAWIRLEPFTRAYEVAVREKSIRSDVDLLPPDTGSLSKTFYISPAVFYADALLFNFLKIRYRMVLAIKVCWHKIRSILLKSRHRRG